MLIEPWEVSNQNLMDLKTHIEGKQISSCEH